MSSEDGGPAALNSAVPANAGRDSAIKSIPGLPSADGADGADGVDTAALARSIPSSVEVEVAATLSGGGGGGGGGRGDGGMEPTAGPADGVSEERHPDRLAGPSGSSGGVSAGDAGDSSRAHNTTRTANSREEAADATTRSQPGSMATNGGTELDPAASPRASLGESVSCMWDALGLRECTHSDTGRHIWCMSTRPVVHLSDACPLLQASYLL
jgi:hypothetical protein